METELSDLLLGNDRSPCLKLLAASLCNGQRQLIHVHGPELGPPPSCHGLEECEGTSLGKPKPFYGEESQKGGQIHCQIT